MIRRQFALVSLFFAIAVAAFAQEPPKYDAAHLRLSLQKLNTVGGALYIAAHPDDENTAMLAWLANGRHVRAGYLALTRGDGGQNLIGSEKGDPLGVIRTEELLEARKIDGAQQFFTRAVDFGFSKSADETLKIWDHDKILADVVWTIRRFRPDILITRFPPTAEAGHGHHTASAILAREAFDAAGDPAKFPEQLRYVEVWKPRRLFWNRFRGASTTSPPDAKVVTLDLGAYNPLLGKSYSEIASDSRSMHKSQGFGSAQRRGSAVNEFELRAGDALSGNDLFEGIDTSWRRIAGSDRLAALLADAEKKFDAENPSTVVSVLLSALTEIDKLPKTPELAEKRDDIVDVIREATGLWIEAIADSATSIPGGKEKIAVTVINRSQLPIRVTNVTVRGTAAASPVVASDAHDLGLNKPATTQLDVSISPEARISQPYWLRDPAETMPGQVAAGTYRVDDSTMIGRPMNPPELDASVDVAFGDQHVLFSEPVMFRWVDRVRGEQLRPFEIAPAIAVSIAPRVELFRDDATKQVEVTVNASKEIANGKATVSLSLPNGWLSAPKMTTMDLAQGSETRVLFAVSPSCAKKPCPSARGVAVPVVEFGGKQYSSTVAAIDHEHIPMTLLFLRTAAAEIRLPLSIRHQNVGYIMGSGDEVPDALAAAGHTVTMLSDDDIVRGDVQKFDAIVVGVRAYNTRDALKTHKQRLLDYVKNGGTAVVQYVTSDETLEQNFGPYPFKISRDRVTVEQAPVSFTEPAHPALNSPNRITNEDFEGWVQERGIYFANEWDPKYSTPLESHDPGEPELKGGLLYAEYGKGVFIYTGYDFFRELPAGVPGAYRLFENLVGAEAKKTK